MHLLSFLGTGNYQPVVYALDGESAPETPFAAVAVARLADATGATLLATEEAETKHGAALSDALSAIGVPSRIARIPKGASPEEHWQIFAAVGEAARRHDSVALDVTHGFRTQPLIGFLSAAFLRATKGAPLDRLLYGAFEAKDDVSGTAPVFDLTPFLELLDWTSAADQFLATGAAERLARLLEGTQNRLRREATSVTERVTPPSQLKSAAKALRTVSEDLLLLRRAGRAASLARLATELEAARDETRVHAPPFAALLDQILDGTADLRSRLDDELATERAQIEWLLNHGRIDAALTLTREWLVSLAASRLRPDQPIPIDADGRDPFATFLNVLASGGRIDRSEVSDELRPALDDPAFAPFSAPWATIRTLRNDLNHAGYNRSSKAGHLFCRDAEAAIRQALDLDQH